MNIFITLRMKLGFDVGLIFSQHTRDTPLTLETFGMYLVVTSRVVRDDSIAILFISAR